MTTPRKNPTIGMIECWTPGCGRLAAIRQDGRRRLYMVCLECGRNAPDGPNAQDAMLDQATIWGEQGEAPPQAPRWIGEDWSHQQTLRDPQGALEACGGDPTEPPGPPQGEPAVAPGDPPQGDAPRTPTGAPPVAPPPEPAPQDPPPDPPQQEPTPEPPADPPPAEPEEPDPDADDDRDDDWP